MQLIPTYFHRDKYDANNLSYLMLIFYSLVVFQLSKIQVSNIKYKLHDIKIIYSHVIHQLIYKNFSSIKNFYDFNFVLQNLHTLKYY